MLHTWKSYNIKQYMLRMNSETAAGDAYVANFV